MNIRNVSAVIATFCARVETVVGRALSRVGHPDKNVLEFNCSAVIYMALTTFMNDSPAVTSVGDFAD